MGDSRLVAQLCELFAQVDVNANGTLEWDEFTSHIVDMVMATHDHKPDTIQNYTPGAVKEVGKRRTSYVKELYYFEANDSVVTCDVDSPDFRVFDAALELRMTVTRDEGQVTCVNYLPEQSQYVVSTSDSMLSFIDEASGVLCKSFRTQFNQQCIEWVGSLQMLYTAEATGTIRAWNVEDMEEKFSMLAPALPPAADSGRPTSGGKRGEEAPAADFAHSRIVLKMLHLSGLDMLATASMDCLISLWDLQTGKHKRSLEGHSKGVCCLSYSPEYRFLASGGFDFDVIVWNPYVEHLILRLPGHNNSICGVQIIANSPQLVTADKDGVFRVWDVRNFACVQTFTCEERWKTGISRFVSLPRHKKLMAVGRAVHTFEYQHLDNPDLTDDTPCFAALYNATTATFVTVSAKDVRIWDARSGALSRVYSNVSKGGAELTAVCLDSLQRKLLVGDHVGAARAINYLNGQELTSFLRDEGDEEGLEPETFHETAESLPDEEEDGFTDTLQIVQQNTCSAPAAPQRSLLKRPKRRRFVDDDDATARRKAHDSEVSRMVYCHEHCIVIMASWDRSISVFDDTDEGGSVLLRRMTGGHAADICALAYSKNLELIASGSTDGGIVVWSFEYGRLEGRCDTAAAAVGALAFVEPYNVLLSADTAGTFQLWAMPPIRGSGNPFKCVAAWMNSDKGDGVQGFGAAILCVVLHTHLLQGEISRCLVVAGCDQGTLSVWEIATLMAELADGPAGVQKIDGVECANTRRNLRYDAVAGPGLGVHGLGDASEKPAAKTRLPGIHAAAVFEDGLVTASLRLVQSFRLHSKAKRLRRIAGAHSEAVISVQYIPESDAIVSSGLDRLVHLWHARSGEALGTLRQGVKTGFGWLFGINETPQHRAQAAHTHDVLEEMHALEAAADAADRAARAAMPSTDADANAQLRKDGDGELHFVLNPDQYDLLFEDEEDGPMGRSPLKGLRRSSAAGDGRSTASLRDDSRLDALADFSSSDLHRHPAPPTVPRSRRAPIGPAHAGRVFKTKAPPRR